MLWSPEDVIVDCVYHLQFFLSFAVAAHLLKVRRVVMISSVVDCVCIRHVSCSVTVRLYVDSTLNTLSVGLQFSLNVHM